MSKVHKQNIHLSFPPEISGEPVVCNLVRLFDLEFTILQARINPRREGEMTLQLRGSAESCEKGIAYLKGKTITVSPLEQRIWHNSDSCMHCGMCTALCPVSALYIDKKNRKLVFEKEKCTACALCVRVCPVKAMQVEASVDVSIN